jgi:hypothetical protein
MANLPVCDEGLLSALANASDWQGPPTFTTGWNLGLYANNYAIVPGSQMTDLVECSFSGYSRFFIIPCSGSPYMLSAGGTAQLDFPPYDFPNTGVTPTTVFGWFWGQPSSGGFYQNLCGGALFSPAVVLLPGQTLRITPHVRLASKY